MKKLFYSGHFVIRVLIFSILLSLSAYSHAQMPAAISIDPPDATAYDQLTLTFDPALACFQSGSLAGLSSIAIHSGVSFITGETWQNVVNFNSIGYNGQPTILLPTGDGKFSITYVPADFYGLTGQIVTQICAVFNNGYNWSQDGRDFIPNSSFCMDFFIPLNFQGTAPEFHFNLNMNKMIHDGNFDPLYDNVYVEMDEVGSSILSDMDQDGIYEGIIDQGIDTGTTYTYRFRINNDLYEDLVREVIAVAGILSIDVWWNDDPIPLVTFVVDMRYQGMLGNFTLYDSVDVVGTMNLWEGSPKMETIGYFLYSITLMCDPGVVEYKFRINDNWYTTEFLNTGINRMTFATPEPVTVYHYYNDCNWDTWPATFEVDMNNEINAGNFDPSVDFLDIAGSMNGWGGHDVLFDREWTPEGIYTASMLIDKLNPFIEFKFRINGNWVTSEFPVGGPDRSWTVQDTTGGLVNLYSCVYNITDLPFAPYVYGLYISGSLVVGSEITGNYTYFDPNADPEGTSLYQWYVSDDPFGVNAVMINGATYQNYTITQNDYGRYLIFEVTPVSATGEPSVGYPAWVISGQVGASGNAETIAASVQLYPNPVSGLLCVKSTVTIEGIRVYDLLGELHYSLQENVSNDFKVDLSGLRKGIYFLILIDPDGNKTEMKFIKN